MRYAIRILLTLAGILIAASSTIAAEPAAPDPQHHQDFAADSTGAIAAQRAWWTAFIVGDVRHLEASTAPSLWLTPSVGKNFDRASMLAEAAKHNQGKNVRIEWTQERVQFPEPSVAIVTSRTLETTSQTSIYRYLTVLQRSGSGWQVRAAQSTRELELTARVPMAVAGALDDYAGNYQTPKGALLRVVVRDGRLMLVEPSGLEIALEPVGPGLFEFDRVWIGTGVVRLMFSRDTGGKVTSFSRLVVGVVNTFARVP